MRIESIGLSDLVELIAIKSCNASIASEAFDVAKDFIKKELLTTLNGPYDDNEFTVEVFVDVNK